MKSFCLTESYKLHICSPEAVPISPTDFHRGWLVFNNWFVCSRYLLVQEAVIKPLDHFITCHSLFLTWKENTSPNYPESLVIPQEKLFNPTTSSSFSLRRGWRILLGYRSLGWLSTDAVNQIRNRWTDGYAYCGSTITPSWNVIYCAQKWLHYFNTVPIFHSFR